MRTRTIIPLLSGAVLLAGCGGGASTSTAGSPPVAGASPEAQLLDTADGNDWPGFGRTYGEQHFSPLAEINDGNIGQLGLAWSLDLDVGNSVTGPIAVDGVIYFARAYSVVVAVDAVSGKTLWTYDPKAPEASGARLRQGWGSRGIAWWNGKVYTATQDGRLIALDAKTGTPVWTSQTIDDGDPRFISGPPRVFDGKVMIGNAGADEANIRGYVTTYDAETGKKLWRFWTVPGNPADGFEDKAMEMAAKTWAGKWWEKGGGGTVWNSISYDKDSDTVFIGTGNGAPWNHKIRSEGKGDNLFLCSIVALDAKTGAYKWHYQINPGESWDFNSSMDMELADLTIDGKPRKVLITVPKNGFVYVLDRGTGKLISAEPFVKVTWARGIDKVTGRPIENPGIRYEDGPTTFSPTPVGAHSWVPMAYSAQSGLVYIPSIELESTFDDRGIDRVNWKRRPGMALDYGVNASIDIPKGREESASALVAWNPVTQKEAWRIPTPLHYNGGVMATAGNLVFQGQMDGLFNAYDAKTGKRLWSYDAKAAVIAPPISFRANGRQYITVLTGNGTSAGFLGSALAKFGIDYRTQARRVLTFAIGGTATLPARIPYRAVAVADTDYRADAAAAKRGELTYNTRCVVCHGGGVAAAGVAPDLRTSEAVISAETFNAIIHDGALVPAGMPRFEDMTPAQRADLRQYIRSKAAELRMGARGDTTAKPVR